MDTRAHWENVYATRPSTQVSWFRPHLETSLALIERSASTPEASILDVGAGQSTLIDDLLARGFLRLTALDISSTALEAARLRLPADAPVHWLCADITQAALPAASFDIWHDRAVFHFLTSPELRAAYIRQVSHSLRPGGHLILATFALDGPARCSGLDVVRYDASSLSRELGPRFLLTDTLSTLHHTPSGATQSFLYTRFQLQ